MKGILFALTISIFGMGTHGMGQVPAFQKALPGAVKKLQTVQTLEHRDAAQNPQAQELLNMYKLADRLRTSVSNASDKAIAAEISHRSFRQLDVALNLPRTGRIAGNGRPAAEGQFPYQVALVFAGYANPYYGQFCGGSLVNQRWVLTAAHCLRPTTKPSDIEIFVGSVKLTHGGKLVPVERLILHAGFKRDTMEHDVALVKLALPVAGQEAIALVDGPLEHNLFDNHGIAVITGWGDTFEGSGHGSDDLLYANIPLVDRTTCNSPDSYAGSIGEGMLCAGDGQSDSCQGDSGGPLVILGPDQKYVQEGIVSWGEGCAKPKKYGVYTRVPQYLTWIRTNMK